MQKFEAGDYVECVDDKGVRLLLNSLHTIVEACYYDDKGTVRLEGDISFYSASRFQLVNAKKRVKDSGEYDDFSEDKPNLWDYIKERVPEVKRKTAKTVIFSFIFNGEILDIAKKNKLSLSTLSQLVRAFDEWTGAEENNI